MAELEDLIREWANLDKKKTEIDRDMQYLNRQGHLATMSLGTFIIDENRDKILEIVINSLSDEKVECSQKQKEILKDIYDTIDPVW